MVLETKPEMLNDRKAWYQDAKFGMFIHWGVYSVAEVEASWPIMAPDLFGGYVCKSHQNQ